MKNNLLFVAALWIDDYEVRFSASETRIVRDGSLIGKSKRRGRIYTMPISAEVQANPVKHNVEGIKLWHQRLAHVNRETIKLM